MSKRSYSGVLRSSKRQKQDTLFYDALAVLLNHNGTYFSVTSLARLMRASKGCRVHIQSWLQSTLRPPAYLRLYAHLNRPRVGYYMLLCQNNKYSIHPLPLGGSLMIGRAKKNDVCIDSDFMFISRCLCTLRYQPNGVFRLDVHGRPAVRIGDVALPQGTQAHPVLIDQRVDICKRPRKYWIWFQITRGMLPPSEIDA